MTDSPVHSQWAAPTGRPARHSKRRRGWLVAPLVIIVAIAVAVTVVIFVPRLGWHRTQYGYDIVEQKTLSADQSWTISLPMTTTAYGPEQGNQWDGTVDVFTDPALTYAYTAVDTTGKLTITGVKGIFSPAQEQATVSSNLPSSVANLTLGNQNAWPSGTYYIVEWKGFFGGALDHPRVHIFTVTPVAGELATPQFTMAVTDQGIPQFSWTSIDGAVGYYILKRNPVAPNTDTSLEIIGTAVGDATSWLASSQDMTYQNARQNGADVQTYNTGFQALDPGGGPCTSDDVSSAHGTTQDDRDNYHASLLYPSYAVVAVDYDGNTTLPAEQNGHDLVVNTPVTTATSQLAAMTPDTNPSLFLPTTYPVVMGDCRVNLFNVTPTSLTTYITGSTVTLTYAVDNTLLTGSVTGADAASKTQVRAMGSQLGLRELTSYGPMEDLNIMASSDVISYSVGRTPSTTAPDSPYTWNGTSDMVKYIAANVFAGNEAIDMSQYIADPNSPLIYDAANEAFLQNPYITDMAPTIGILNDVLYVNYEMSPDARAASAARIKDKVDQVTAAIITPGMSDRDKALAINKYLATTAVYDTAAADFASTSNHTVQDYINRFPNSWDAEGVLIDGTGVCSSYASAFKALADASGLVSVTVTGYADNSGQGHEWIKAQLGGTWQIIDPTWNSNIWEQVRGNIQTYFGLTDTQAKRTPFDAFVVDSFIPNYDTP